MKVTEWYREEGTVQLCCIEQSSYTGCMNVADERSESDARDSCAFASNKGGGYGVGHV